MYSLRRYELLCSFVHFFDSLPELSLMPIFLPMVPSRWFRFYYNVLPNTFSLCLLPLREHSLFVQVKNISVLDIATFIFLGICYSTTSFPSKAKSVFVSYNKGRDLKQQESLFHYGG